jgi:hypothetical protein
VLEIAKTARGMSNPDLPGSDRPQASVACCAQHECAPGLTDPQRTLNSVAPVAMGCDPKSTRLRSILHTCFRLDQVSSSTRLSCFACCCGTGCCDACRSASCRAASRAFLYTCFASCIALRSIEGIAAPSRGNVCRTEVDTSRLGKSACFAFSSSATRSWRGQPPGCSTNVGCFNCGGDGTHRAALGSASEDSARSPISPREPP